MIKVAFLDLVAENWTAGAHYLRNLLIALNTLEDNQIEPYVFVGMNTPDKLLNPLKPLAKIIRDPLFDRRQSLVWYVWKIVFLATGSNCFLNNLMRKHDINVVSHSKIWGKKLDFKLVGWIPDFQHMHLPEFFSKKESRSRDKYFTRVIEDSDMVVVSSNDAASDLEKFRPGHKSKVKVLRFVSQPAFVVQGDDHLERSALERKYSFTGKYFYLPNQFWAHKNHRIVFEAVSRLKSAGINVLLLCSGLIDDFRNQDHIAHLMEYIRSKNLEENIKILGLVDYADVFALMRNSVAVINPSLFEGWSSTVEEAKSMGKGMILSEIAVHLEQNPPASKYFPPSDLPKLVELLKEYWLTKEGGPDFDLESVARDALSQRTLEFGRAYQEIILELSA